MPTHRDRAILCPFPANRKKLAALGIVAPHGRLGLGLAEILKRPVESRSAPPGLGAGAPRA